MDPGFWLFQTLNALQLSMLLFLLSVGLTVIFGLMHFVNLAHGALYAFGAYLAATVAGQVGFWAGFALAPLLVAGIGLGLYATLIRRMRRAGPMAQVLVTFGLIFAKSKTAAPTSSSSDGHGASISENAALAAP